MADSTGGLLTSTSTEDKLYSIAILLREFDRWNLPEEDRKKILAIVMVESAFDPNAVSTADAKGIGQIKEDTAYDLLLAGGLEASIVAIPPSKSKEGLFTYRS
jgi:soluble lytic murein transglycosylase-like protein